MKRCHMLQQKACQSWVILPPCLRESPRASPGVPELVTEPVLSSSLFNPWFCDLLQFLFLGSHTSLELARIPFWQNLLKVSGCRSPTGHRPSWLIDGKKMVSCPARFVLKGKTKCSMSSENLSIKLCKWGRKQLFLLLFISSNLRNFWMS